MDTAAENLKGSGEQLQMFLDVMARFDRYSLNNALLILEQMPDAARLKTFEEWKAAGVSVNRGETAVSLLEPGKEYTRDNGETGVSINVKKVFDVSQTNSRQRGTPTVTRDERLLLKSLITGAPCRMVISDTMPEQLNAIYKPEERTIYVRAGMDAQTIFRSLVNELAHAHMDKGNYQRNENTVAAYCVSYVLCRRSGVSTDSFDFTRVPGRFQRMNSQELRGELNKIRSVAGEITRDMKRVLEAQARSQRERKDEAR